MGKSSINGHFQYQWIGLRENLQESPIFNVDFPLNQSIDKSKLLNYQRVYGGFPKIWLLFCIILSDAWPKRLKRQDPKCPEYTEALTAFWNTQHGP